MRVLATRDTVRAGIGGAGRRSPIVGAIIGAMVDAMVYPMLGAARAPQQGQRAHCPCWLPARDQCVATGAGELDARAGTASEAMKLPLYLPPYGSTCAASVGLPWIMPMASNRMCAVSSR